MDPVFSGLLQQLWPLALVMLGLGYLIRLGQRQKRQGAAIPATGGKGAPQNSGIRHFSGTTQGLAWGAEVLNLPAEVDDGQANRVTLSRSYTRWTCPDCRNPGSPILLMPLPEGMSARFSAPPEESGFLDALADRAGSVALAGFLVQRFGAARVAGMSFPASHRAPLGENAFGGGYGAWCAQPEPVARLAHVARNWFVQAQADPPALLWDTRGLTLHWPQGLSDGESVARIAERGAELARSLQA